MLNLCRKEATIIVKEKKIRTKQPTKICCSCPPEKAEKPISQFYQSFSKLHADGRVPMCKECILEKCYDNEKDDINIDAFKSILRQIDKPFIDSVFQSSLNQYNKTYAGKNVKHGNRKSIISYYFKNINTLRQYKTLNWEQGIAWNKRIMTQVSNGVQSTVEDIYSVPDSHKKEDRIYSLDDSDFIVTKDIIKLFGNGYTKPVYKAMWEKYDFLSKSYPDITNLHTEALVTYVRFKVKEEMATAQGNAIDAEKWNQAATRAADKAKINPSQLSQSDLQGGLNSFSELALMVEQSVDVIPILPRFKFRPNDAIDFNIWCLINYLRDLEGKSLCKYEDVYKFYDKRKKEYIEQYGDPTGIFTDDPTEKNRDAIKKFITLPKDYEDDNSSSGDENE